MQWPIPSLNRKHEEKNIKINSPQFHFNIKDARSIKLDPSNKEVA